MERSPLSRERICEAALRLADERGVETVTMRRLGEALGYEAMSLYRHVANKDEVLDGVLDLVLGEMQPPDPEGAWGPAVRASAVSVRDALRRHPWATGLLMTPSRIRPARVAYMNALLGRLRNAGFSPEATYHAYHVLDGHIFGFSLWQTSYEATNVDLPDLVAKIMREIPFDEYPYLAEHRDQHFAEGPLHEINAFEVGLDLILEGLERSRTSS